VERKLELVVGIWWPVRSVVTAMSQRLKRAAAPLAQPPQVKPRITTDLDKVLEQLEHLVALHGRSVLTREERLDVLHVYFAVVRDGLMQQKKTGRNITVNALEKTASLLGLPPRLTLKKRWRRKYAKEISKNSLTSWRSWN